MNIVILIYLIISAAVLNLLVYYIFKRFLLPKPNAAIKFLITNIVKDFVWAGLWIYLMEKSTVYFLAITLVFILGSTLLFYNVIKTLNGLEK